MITNQILCPNCEKLLTFEVLSKTTCMVVQCFCLNEEVAYSCFVEFYEGKDSLLSNESLSIENKELEVTITNYIGKAMIEVNTIECKNLRTIEFPNTYFDLKNYKQLLSLL